MIAASGSAARLAIVFAVESRAVWDTSKVSEKAEATAAFKVASASLDLLQRDRAAG